MSQVTSFVLICNACDVPVVRALALYMTPVGEEQHFVDVTAFANSLAHGPQRKMLQLLLAATAVNYADNADVIRRVSIAPWKIPECVMLLVKGEEDWRPAVWAFAVADGAFRELVPARPQ